MKSIELRLLADVPMYFAKANLCCLWACQTCPEIILSMFSVQDATDFSSRKAQDKQTLMELTLEPPFRISIS
jgi:hypothetical protein